MTTPWQTAQLNFRGGVDQRTVAELVDPETRLLDVVNGIFQHDGSVEKRPGVQALATTSTSTSINGNGFGPMGNAAAVFSRGGQLLATDGDGLYAYSAGLGSWSSVATYTNVGFRGTNDRVSPCYATRDPLITAASTSGTLGPTELAVAEGSGVRAVVWRETGGNQWLRYSLYDLTTGAVIASGLPLTGSSGFTNPIPVIQGGYLFIFYADSGHIYWQSFNLTTQAWTSGTLVSDAANAVYDATPYTGASSGILIVYNQTTSTGRPRYLRLENLPALTITASGIVNLPVGLTLVAASVISARYDATLGVAFIAWENPAVGGSVNNLCVAAYNVPAWTVINLAGSSLPFQPTIPNYTQGGGTPARFINIEPINATQFLVQAVWGTSGGPYSGQAVYTNSTGVQVSNTTYPYGWIAGRPFRATSGGVTRCYVPFCFFAQITSIGSSPSQFATVFLMDTRAYETPVGGVGPYPRAVATLAPRQASELYYATTMQASGAYRPPLVTNPGTPGAGTYRFAIAINPSEEWGTVVTPPAPVFVDLATVSFSPSWSYTEGDEETYFAGGVPMVYAGQGVNEIGLLCWPSRMTSGLFGGGGLTPSSTYGYAFVFSEPDASGLIHRSAPYLANVTLGAGQGTVQWTFPVIPYTQRGSVVIEVYRTAANGTIYYYCGQVSAYGTSITATVTYTDTAADTSITSNALLYTTGGVLDSVCPPSFRQVIRHVERLWGIDDTGLVIWYTTTFSPSDAPWFNEALTLQFTDETLVALQGMDDKLVVYSSAHIWYVEGQGPDNLGNGSDLTTAVLLPSDVGCASPQSVVAFPGGQFFQAPSGGIYLLDRGLNVTYVGKEVQDITAGVQVVSAELVPTSNHVRFVLSTGIVLTFDYVLGRWARLQLTSGIFGTPLSAAMVNGVWTAPCSSGMVAQEKSVVGLPAHCYQDSTAAGVHSFVPTTVKLAHLRPGGLDGWAQLGFVQGRADWLDPADVQMTLTYDYGAATQSGTYTYQTLHGAYPTQARWRMGPQAANSMASAVQATLTDASPTGGSITTGQGVRWLGLAFEFMPLGPLNLNISPAATQ